MSIIKLKWMPIDSAGVVVCVLLTAATAWLGFAPIWQKHATYLQEQHELQTKKHDAADAELALKTAQKKLSLTQLKLDQIPLHLQPTTQLNQRLAAVTNLAAEYNLKIDEITPGSAAKGQRYDTIRIHVAGEGSYPACANFLHHLNHTMPDIGIQTLKITSQGATAAAKFIFDLQWFAAASPASDVATAQ